MPIVLFAALLAIGLFIVEKLLINPIDLLFSLHLPRILLWVGGLSLLAWLLDE